MTQLKWTEEEAAAILRIRRDIPRDVRHGITDHITENGDLIVREIRAAVEAERAKHAPPADFDQVCRMLHTIGIDLRAMVAEYTREGR